MERQKWLDTHVHVSDIGPDGKSRPRLLQDLLAVLDGDPADLRWVISPNGHWLSKLSKNPEEIGKANAFVHDLVRRAPGRLYGSCMVNPNFPKESLRAMEKAFGEWGFVQLGELLPYIMNHRMDCESSAEIVRAAARYDVPVQVHISTSNSAQGNFASGMEELYDLFGAVRRVPEAKYILAHAVGLPKDNPPIVDGYLDAVEKEYGRWPENFWLEVRDFSSPGVRSALARVPAARIIAGTDWVSRVGPPFLPYGVVFGAKTIGESPYPPGVSVAIALLRKWGASEAAIAQIAYGNAAKLLRLPGSCRSLNSEL